MKPKPLDTFNFLHRLPKEKKQKTVNLSLPIYTSERFPNPKDPVVTAYEIILSSVNWIFIKQSERFLCHSNVKLHSFYSISSVTTLPQDPSPTLRLVKYT